MIKNKETLIKEKVDEVANKLKNYIDDMDILSETGDFSIDRIEEKWEQLEESTRQIYRDTNNEIIKQFNEREIIRSKKGNTLRKEWF